jgi:hypothetical protein
VRDAYLDWQMRKKGQCIVLDFVSTGRILFGFVESFSMKVHPHDNAYIA